MASPPAARPSATADEIARLVGAQVRGDGALLLTGIADLESAGPSDLSFLARPEYRERAARTRAGGVIVREGEELPGRTLLVAESPHRSWALAMRFFHPAPRHAAGVAPTAVVAADASLGSEVHVGPLAVLGPGVRVGARSALLPGVVLGAGCEIGEDCVVHPGAVLYPGTVLGDRVIIHARVVLGSDGFGYASGPEGHLKVPHAGRVVVEDDVEIGAGTCVDRGAMGETRIGKGTKIDNLVQVGHNVSVGEGSLLVAQCGIAGSTRLGPGTVLAGQSGVAGHLQIGAGAQVAAKSAVLQDVSAGEKVAGIPAMPLMAWKRAVAALARLPELLRRVRRLEEAAEGKTEP